MSLRFGVNLNNREPLIAPDYDLPMLLDLSGPVEELGFDSVWVGDSLFSKPRYEPIALLSAISQRTPPGGPRHGLHGLLARATRSTWRWSGRPSTSSRAGAPSSAPAPATPRRACGASSPRSASTSAAARTIFEEGLAVLRALWTEGRVDFHGEHFDYDDVSFSSGTEIGPADARPDAAADLGGVQPAR